MESIELPTLDDIATTMTSVIKDERYYDLETGEMSDGFGDSVQAESEEAND